jgi:putative transposase
MVESDHEQIPVIRQCRLLGLSRSSLYYQPHRDEQAAEFELQLLNAIDVLYTAHPHLGRHGMTDALAEQYGLEVNPKRVRRLMKQLGLEAVYPRPRKNTSLPSVEHPKYPYLLRNLPIIGPDQVWCADITYIRLYRGFAYLVAVMDWYSRCVLSWELSNTLDASFCVEALQRALASGRSPAIFNTDQGSQFTSEMFTGVLSKAGIAISMDGVGRAFDNIMVERLWRSVKYEDVYLRDYQTPAEARTGLERYFGYYNHLRRHSSLDRRTPGSVYGLVPSALDQKLLVQVSGRTMIGGSTIEDSMIEGSVRRRPTIDTSMIKPAAASATGTRKTGDGRSIAAHAAAATLALRAPSAAAATSPMPRVPPYSGPITVQRMGTS